MNKFWSRGEPFIWATGLALSLTLLIALTLIIVVMVNGLGVFWPGPLTMLDLADGSKALGKIIREERGWDDGKGRLQLKVANRDLYGLDFRWINRSFVVKAYRPADVIVIERKEYGDFYGYLKQVIAPNAPGAKDGLLHERFDQALRFIEHKEKASLPLQRRLSALSRESQRVRLSMKKLAYRGIGENSQVYQDLLKREEKLGREFEDLAARQSEDRQEILRNAAVFRDASGVEKTIPFSEIVRYHQPNQMQLLAKSLVYAAKLKELLLGQPREANTEGGLFPAIFGTVMMVFLMSLLSFPLGVLAGIYLREYAKEGIVVRMVRIAVNNLAGIPSIVYGIFGLGFFIYGVGAAIDRIFFPERLPAPTFGTGGILWASLTLGLLTVPVVIVATEEALGSIPRNIRDGALSLGATKFQTLVRILLPMASPGIMTGFILAMARAAGEVAPLMITGVVKLAPALPLDGTFPYVHLDRKFMHLGFHIYDIGFQSPNVEAAKPMVFVTTLLLVLIVLVMSSSAIYLRNKMQKRYSMRSV